MKKINKNCFSSFYKLAGTKELRRMLLFFVMLPVEHNIQGRKVITKLFFFIKNLKINYIIDLNEKK